MGKEKVSREERAKRRRSIAEDVINNGIAVKRVAIKWGVSGPMVHNAVKEYKGIKPSQPGMKSTLAHKNGHQLVTMTFRVPAQQGTHDGQTRVIGWQWLLEEIYRVAEKFNIRVENREFGDFERTKSEVVVEESKSSYRKMMEEIIKEADDVSAH